MEGSTWWITTPISHRNLWIHLGECVPQVMYNACLFCPTFRNINPVTWAGTALNLISVQSIMRAILKERHPTILYENGGTLKLSKWFCKKFVKRHLNWTIRKATTAAQKVPHNWHMLVDEMIKRLAIVVYEGQIPKELLFSMDETFCFFVPMGHTTTLAERGSKVRVHATFSIRSPTIYPLLTSYHS